MTARTTLVCGATGYVGRHVVRALHRDGHSVRALVRGGPERLGELAGLCDDVFTGEATDAATLEGLCDGVQTVVSTLGSRSLKRRPTFWDVDWRGNINVLDQAVAAGVEHFVFISVLDGDRWRARVPQAEARERVVDALVASPLAWTVYRPTGFFNDMGEMFDMARKGTGWVIGDGQTRINPIHGADLADVLAEAVRDPALRGTMRNLGGPETFTMRGIVELAFEVLGKPPRIRSAPAWTIAAAAWAARPFNANVSSLLAMFHEGALRDGVGDAVGTHRLRELFEELARG